MRLLIALTFAFPFVYKYSYVVTNQYTQIPIILSYLYPNYLSNDWYVSVNKSFGPRSFFAMYLAQVGRFFDLPFVFFLHYLLYIFLIIISSYRLTYLLFKNKFVSSCTTITILFASSITIGGNILVTRDFSAPQLPLGLTLLALVMLLEKRYLLTSLLLSIASYLHPLIGFESAGIFFIAYLTTLWLSKETASSFIKRTVSSYFLLTFPAIFLYLESVRKSSLPSQMKISILAYMRTPHHYLPSTWPKMQFIHFFIFILIYVFMLIRIKRANLKLTSSFFKLLTFFVLLFCLIGFIGTEILPYYPIVVAQPFRLSLYLFFVGAIIIVGESFYLSQKKLIFKLLLIIPIFFFNFLYFLDFGKIRLLAFIIGVLLVLLFHKIPKYTFVILLLIYFSLFKFHEKFNFSSYYLQPTEEIDLAKWAKTNTPPEATFLVPPEFESFRLIANRAIVADWKAFPFQETAMLEWAKRMCEIGNFKDCNYAKISNTDISSGYRTHNQSSLRNLFQIYDFDYVITDQELPFLQKVYQRKISIYKSFR